MAPFNRRAALMMGVAFALAACAPNHQTQTQTPAAIPTATFSIMKPTMTPVPTVQQTSPSSLPCSLTNNSQAEGLLHIGRSTPTPSGAIVVQEDGIASDGVTMSRTDELFGVCAKATTADAIAAFYATQMPALGWKRTATLPNGGSCTVSDCWKMVPEPNAIETMMITTMRSVGADVEFTIEIAIYNYS